MIEYVIYHKNSADGFGAYYAICTQVYNPIGIPCQYGDPVPELPPNASVAVVDFCFSKEEMDKLADQCSHLLVVDHHESSKWLLDWKYPKTAVIWDCNHSCALLTLKYFSDRIPPQLLQYVEDRDLWKLPRSREVSAALASYPQNIDTWDNLIVARLGDEGIAILRANKQYVENQIKKAKMASFGGYMVESTHLVSEVGEALVKKFGFPACVFYHENRDKVKLSFRSDDGSALGLAKKFGGGGHPNAAGASINAVDLRNLW